MCGFKVHFSGVAPCKDDEQVFSGTLDVVADGSVVAQKRVGIGVPPCKPKETFSYSVKFLCGVQPACECHCAPLRPGAYATDINIHNYHDAEVEIEKMFIPLVFAGAVVGRAPRASRPRAAERQTLAAFSATMEDCCTINQALLGGSGGENTGLMIGFLHITSPVELSVTAVYTSGSPDGGSPNVEVLSVEGKVMR